MFIFLMLVLYVRKKVMRVKNNPKIPKNRIAELRKEKKLSQVQLAQETGLTRQAISLYEIGKREPRLETWMKLANFFGVSVSYLQGLTDKDYRKELILDEDRPYVFHDFSVQFLAEMYKFFIKDRHYFIDNDQKVDFAKKIEKLSDEQARRLEFEMSMLLFRFLDNGVDNIDKKMYKIFRRYYYHRFRKEE